MCRRAEFLIDLKTGKRLSVKLDAFKKGEVADQALDAISELLGKPAEIEESEEYHRPYVVATEKQGS